VSITPGIITVDLESAGATAAFGMKDEPPAA
jgi:hypothetical protein